MKKVEQYMVDIHNINHIISNTSDIYNLVVCEEASENHEKMLTNKIYTDIYNKNVGEQGSNVVIYNVMSKFNDISKISMQEITSTVGNK